MAQERQSRILTFYSYKGGVGRTMALANTACALAQSKRRVLVIDWDLEAPGLERYFNSVLDEPLDTQSRPGVVDLVDLGIEHHLEQWRSAIFPLQIEPLEGRIDYISAGRRDDEYSSRLHQIDWGSLFEKASLGVRLEELRNSWLDDYDFVLIDSRTGATDIGGICTVHLADLLLVLFTANEQSLAGTLEITERVKKARQHLPFDRDFLVTIPIAGRDESRTEYSLALEWRRRFAVELNHLYRDWLPSDVTSTEALEILRLPHVPYWSFGERIPVLEEGTIDPTSLGHAYARIARLVDSDLDWRAAVNPIAGKVGNATAEVKEGGKYKGVLLAAMLLLVIALGVTSLVLSQSDADGSESTVTSPSTETSAQTPATVTTASPSAASTSLPLTTSLSGSLDLLQIADLVASGGSTEGFDACGGVTNFDVANLADGNLATAWRIEGNGVGQFVQASFSEEYEIVTVGLVPGYAKVDACDGTDRFFQNRRVRSVIWTVTSATETFTFEQEFDPDVAAVQTVDLPRTAQGALVIAEISETTADGGRDFVAISDLALRGRPVEEQ